MLTTERRSRTVGNKFKRWFFEGIRASHRSAPSHQDVWWKVMCLTGLDYFSTLGYQPGIAFLAASFLSPIATAIVVFVTLCGLVPLYFRVAAESPFGQGSVAMLENLLPGWKGKTFVLILLGFAATGFVITITLSAADATAHIIQNPFVPMWMRHKVILTLIMVAILGGVFLKGFKEAIGVAVSIVFFYLICNAVVVGVGLQQLFFRHDLLLQWHDRVFSQYHNWWTMLGLSMILFPKLALGMSGFETGVAVLPLVKGDPQDSPDNPVGRIRNGRKLLLTAALIMAVFLLCSGVITTLLIPPAEFAEGGLANGRALAYLAHGYLGEGFGTVYDISTILILWFAGASAIAGLLTLIPRYLPRYGMAPDWARAQRPLVSFITVVCFAVTLIFRADVDAQAGAYATGILVLFTSAALAVCLVTWSEGMRKRIQFGLILLVFVYTTIANMVQRPEGLQIATFFIATMLVTSLFSRAMRSLELRIQKIEFDETAGEILMQALETEGGINLLAHRPGSTDYAAKEEETRRIHKLTEDEASFVFLEVGLSDPSDFIGDCVIVRGHRYGNYRILTCHSPAIPNAIAALLLNIRDHHGVIPHAYFGWTEGHPLSYVFKYIFLGEGETAPITREILREVEPDPSRRPVVIVG